jgi:hypothetical protein
MIVTRAQLVEFLEWQLAQVRAGTSNGGNVAYTIETAPEGSFEMVARVAFNNAPNSLDGDVRLVDPTPGSPLGDDEPEPPKGGGGMVH